ncbi:hypothetical protein RhiirA5_439515 [Rhizophagus irregularis]|uniref:MULE transposase domain-containing protein n=1 Tax=Rhizophagus irregularis TaxID=588596 RepID=A0A2I1EPB5_9GLOM|nr:hypothetical protein RhiirA5_439515 [Rhizophagus irregularis]GBC48897.2 protein FAR1-RELATED SEQUENCE 5-like [Rhizophagus irregularis DAOM 181602=DAOM 197198]PKC52923.1 hypothetical protein RhiirA1_480377 [Rhizophagus irregularis]PKY13151.1 hypothetical protein RhiirB3_424911 [Rhizophagus irregularis]PKY23915.1 hypothetical protein RhiirB3_438275 [Rhizophagus irregularis]
MLEEIEFLINIGYGQKFYDVAINDNTSQANKYQIYLSLTIVINNHAKSRMAATAVVSDKTKDSTYQWILKCLLRVTNGLVLRVLFIDAFMKKS